MKQTVTIALAKGRLAEKAVEIFKSIGIKTTEDIAKTRKLIVTDEEEEYRFLLVKPTDVATYVERGVADLGFVGKDSLVESGADVYELADLGFGACKLCVCGFPSCDYKQVSKLKVATKYVNVASRYFGNLGQDVDIIELHGSVELAPLTFLSDVILDVVESGETLRANGLAVLDFVMPSSARLVCNKASLKTKSKAILPLINEIKEKVK